ncbi:alpha/beta fold hydrolase [Rhizobium ruizarguesonis]|uniref:Alpha/beta fold hydrolase n=1 Tax=Rhizobium ruizarguesonis TaxID=2081791 RepID=A0ACD5ET51_9HYPH
MAKQVLFNQGAGEGVHDRWDNKLVASLERELGKTYAVRYPHMPCEDNPRYAAWKATLVSEFAALEDGSLLVGHSVGGTILTHVLAEQPPKVRLAGLFIIAAPFIGEGGWPSDDIDDGKDLTKRLPARHSRPSLSRRRRRRGTHRPCPSLCQSDPSRRDPHA